MRKTNEHLKNYINEKIAAKKVGWGYRKGANYGVPLQIEVGNYFRNNKDNLDICRVKVNVNPNDDKPDVVITYNNGTEDGYEVKSCKDGALNGVTICNAPQLLNDKKTFLINYTVKEDNVIYVLDVYETQIFRLTSINHQGKYKGCLISTRDTGKKIKGRSFNDFISTNEEDDYTLAQLTDPDLIRKTILYYSASKLVDSEFNFSEEEIIEALRTLKKE